MNLLNLRSCIALALIASLAASCSNTKQTARAPARKSKVKPYSKPSDRNIRRPPGKAPRQAEKDPILVKYAAKLGVQPSDLKSAELYAFIDQWTGTPYRLGGMDKKGVDCSGFTCMIYKDVFHQALPRTTRTQSAAAKHLTKGQLQEGDLVFFSISRKDSHVGIYLVNGYFAHASSSSGVVISKLDNPYYKKYFSRGGRL